MDTSSRQKSTASLASKSSPKKKIQTADHAESAEEWNSSAYFAYSAVLPPFYFGGVFESSPFCAVFSGAAGTPPELSGQLHPGNRILAFAPAYATLRRGKPEPGRAVAPSEGGQGDNSFVEAHSLSLRDIVQMVRGAPGTLLQLQVLSADAPPNSPPRTVPIIRDQIRFKQ